VVADFCLFLGAVVLIFRSGTYTLDLKDFFIEFYCLIGCIFLLTRRHNSTCLYVLRLENASSVAGVHQTSPIAISQCGNFSPPPSEPP